MIAVGSKVKHGARVRPYRLKGDSIGTVVKSYNGLCEVDFGLPASGTFYLWLLPADRLVLVKDAERSGAAS